MSPLSQIAENLWSAETHVAVGGGLVLPLRMCVVRDAQGLVLHSPIELNQGLRQELKALGEVHTVIAPNLLHHKWAMSAKRHYPEAVLLGPQGLPKKRPELQLDATLEPGPVPGGLVAHAILGAEKLSEYVFYHESSGSLIVTDLVFSIPRASGMSWLILKWVSRALGCVEQSHLLRYMTDNREATAKSLNALFALPFQRLIPAHGVVVDQLAKEQLSAGTWWMQGKPQRPNAPPLTAVPSRS